MQEKNQRREVVGLGELGVSRAVLRGAEELGKQPS